jgi:uncharacterized protein YaaQ
MKLLLIIVQEDDVSRLRDALSKEGVPYTKLSSTGGFLRRGACTFLTGIEDDQVSRVKQLVEDNSRKRTAPMPEWTSFEMSDMSDALREQDVPHVKVGGATVFVLNVEEFVKL